MHRLRCAVHLAPIHRQRVAPWQQQGIALVYNANQDGQECYPAHELGRRQEVNVDEAKLKTHKIVRDPVQGDIALSSLEQQLIDTEQFQRLRRIRQLGTTYLLYPGALHTRFDHSLGALAEAQRILQAIDLNPETDKLSVEEKVIARICALLHDIGHIPFGHTLEDESGILTRHDSRATYEALLGPDTEIGQLIREQIGRDEETGRDVGEEVRRRVVDILSAKDEKALKEAGSEDAAIGKLGNYAVIWNIVGNTICADLFDYLKRDAYFAGLEERFGTRFMNYLYVAEYGDGTAPKARRLVLRLHKFNSPRMRHDVLSQALALLRLRYVLAERIYYHHSKMCTSAMVSAAIQYSGFPADRDELSRLGDDGLLTAIAQRKDHPAAATIADCLLRRLIYKPVYEVEYSEHTAGNTNKKVKVDRLVEELCRPSGRIALQTELENRFQLPPGTVVAYCPDTKMQLKEAKALVAWAPERINHLEDYFDRSYKAEINTINERHEALWRTFVSLHPDYLGRALEVAAYCAEKYDLANDLPKDRLVTYITTATTETARILPKSVVEMWLDKYGWFKHGKLEETLADNAEISALMGDFTPDLGTLDGISQVNLGLHLRTVLNQENDRDLKPSKELLIKAIRERPGDVLRIAEEERQRLPMGLRKRRDLDPKTMTYVAYLTFDRLTERML